MANQDITVKKNGNKGKIVFYEFFQPPMDSGDYKVVVQKTVSSTNATQPFAETFKDTLTFSVKGIRYQVVPGDIHTTFPPQRGQGEYSNVLPHLVLNVKTLPWQRESDIPANSDGLLYPWLALMVFDQNDPAPTLQTGTLKDILPATAPADVFSYPEMKVDYGEASTDLCKYIDVPLKLFQKIAPQVTDLPWLATARKIDKIDNKSLVDSKAKPHTEFSVVVGNRLPKAGYESTCHLISIEGIGPYLPGGSKKIPTGKTTVRLVSLTSWSFSSLKEKESFANYLENANRKPGTPQIPITDSDSAAHDILKKAFSMGYTAISHHTRQGANTVSWYRGPLLPFENKLKIDLPIPSADALLKYNPDTGMFDTSLSSAWNLGRMVTLSNKQIATMIYNWKRDNQQQQIEAFEKDFLAGRLQIDPRQLNTAEKPMLHHLFQQYVKPLFLQMLDDKNNSDDNVQK